MRSRNYCFTINNYTEGDLLQCKTLECRYLVVGEEVGESGTPHLQGTVCFVNTRTFSAVKKDLPKAHIEVCRNVQSSITYCKKDGKFFEKGDPPKTPQEIGKNEKERWKDVRLAAEEGRWDDIPESVRFNQAKLIKYHYDMAQLSVRLEDTEEEHLWYCGPPGTGKSRKAREENPDAYLKMCNKWWDGYDNEDVVLIEDFDASHTVLCHHLKIWADRYPFMAEYKGGARKIRPKKIIVTSNYHPKDIWQKAGDLDPILRRFAVWKFGNWDDENVQWNFNW